MASTVFTTSPTMGATRDRRILESGDRSQVSDRIGSIFGNRNVDLSFGANEGESGDQRISRLTDSVLSGDRDFGSIRQSVDRLQGLGGRVASQYPTTLPGLSAEQLGTLAERRRAVDARFKEAMARSGAESTRVSAEGLLSSNQLGREFQRSTRDGMGELAGRGTARNPRQGGRFLRDQRDAETEQRAELQRDVATRRRALQMFLEDARRGRDEELLGITSDEVNMRADVGRLFPGAEWF